MCSLLHIAYVSYINMPLILLYLLQDFAPAVAFQMVKFKISIVRLFHFQVLPSRKMIAFSLFVSNFVWKFNAYGFRKVYDRIRNSELNIHTSRSFIVRTKYVRKSNKKRTAASAEDEISSATLWNMWNKMRTNTYTDIHSLQSSFNIQHCHLYL